MKIINLKINKVIYTAILLLAESILCSNTMAATSKKESIKIHIDINQSIGQSKLIHNLIESVDYHLPSPEIQPLMKEINIKGIRLINVDFGNTKLIRDNGKLSLEAKTLDGRLQWCKELNVIPHIIIGQGIPQWLSSHGNNIKYGPKDWGLYKEYIKAYMRYVIVNKGFRNAIWEVANEPNVGDAPVLNYPHLIRGGQNDYKDYLTLYANISEVVEQLEKELGLSITIGGPACLLRFNTESETFNWFERFFRDVSSKKLKCNFISLHYYGNSSAIGQHINRTKYLPFGAMMQYLNKWRDQYLPNVPLWVTEWGASGRVNTEAGLLNSTSAGAAWSAEFLKEMVRHKVGKAILLSTQGNWTWPALFHDNKPSATYYVFSMFQNMQGQLLETAGGSVNVGAMASCLEHKLVAVIWNYNWHRGEQDLGFDESKPEQIKLEFNGISANKPSFRIILKQISEDYGNSYNVKIPAKKALPNPQIIELGKKMPKNGILQVEFQVPPSSVTMIEASPE